MSDVTNKAKPKAERLARMEGCTGFRDLREGFGRGAVDLTDHDVMAALAVIRAKVGEVSNIEDIGPECVETYYGSNQRHRQRLVLAYMRATHRKEESGTRIVIRRLAATLAAQQLAGISFDRSQWLEYAYIAHCRRETLEGCARDAAAWLFEQTDTATRRLLRALGDIQTKSNTRKAQRWEDMAAAPNRAHRIAQKVSGH